MKRMLSLVLMLALVLTLCPFAQAESAEPLKFTYMTITSDTWSVEDAPMQEAMRAHISARDICWRSSFGMYSV